MSIKLSWKIACQKHVKLIHLRRVDKILKYENFENDKAICIDSPAIASVKNKIHDHSFISNTKSGQEPEM